MSAPPVEKILHNTALFEGISFSERAHVLEYARQHSLSTGEFLFMQGDPAETLYILLSGKIKLTQVTPDGQQVILRYAAPGEVFALIAVLSGASYPVSAEVAETSQVLAWHKPDMQQLMLEIPTLSQNAIRILATRVIEFQDRIRELATERVERRIARTLLRLARQAGRKVDEGVLIDIPLSRQDLAQLAGTTLFTVSRTLSRWEEKGLIVTGREKVIIRFPHGLVAIAEELQPPSE